MNFKLFLLALAGSVYGISKIEKCAIDKCTPMDQACINDCMFDNVTPEQLMDVTKCVNKCPFPTGTDSCSVKCVKNLMDLPEQQVNDASMNDEFMDDEFMDDEDNTDETITTIITIQGGNTNGTTTDTSLNGGAKTNGTTDGGTKANGTTTATSTDSGVKSKETATDGNKSNDATTIIAKTTSFTWVMLFGMAYFL